MKAGSIRIRAVPSDDPIAFAHGYMQGLAAEPWRPDEEKIEALLPVVGSREKAIECLRALRKKPKVWKRPQPHHEGYKLGEKVRDGEEPRPEWDEEIKG